MLRVPPPSRMVVFLIGVLLAGCAAAPRSGGEGSSVLFCFWNVENFFDDHRDGERREPDRDFDTWFADEPQVFEQKVKNLTEVLLTLGDGKGPDILALAEVETERAAQALADSLNRRLPEGTPPYKHVLWENPHGGRSISTAILTRLPVNASRTQLLGRRLRILEGHIEVQGQQLVVLATHWTSRVSDKEGEGRAKYADQVYGRYRAMHRSNPDVCMLVCGDFNDNPDDPSVREHLHAVGDLDQVRRSDDPPLLYDVFASEWDSSRGKVGTHFYRGKGYIFDHIVVSPGLINGKGGWQCEVDTARIVKHRFMRKDRPLAFGTVREKVPLAERGASDHLPVTVRLKVLPAP